MCGGDPLSVRQMYGQQFILEPKATTFLCCNDVPAPSNCDGGISRRIRVIPFEQKFVPNPNPNKPNERRIDIDLDKKMDTWPTAFAYLLYLYRCEHSDPNVDDCDDVLAYTKGIEKENDHFYRFADEILVELSPEEHGDRRFYTPLETIQLAYENFYASSKIRKMPNHSLRRRLCEVYGSDKYDQM